MIMTLEKIFGRFKLIVIMYLKMRNIFSAIDDFYRKLLGKKPVLSRLEYHAAEHCNLNCKGCFHFSNLVSSDKFPSITQFSADMSRLSELFGNIGIISLMGGEPLLNPQLPQIIREARKTFPRAKINLRTNGILYQKIEGDLLESIISSDVLIQVSLYKPMAHKRDELKHFFGAKKIRHWISNPILHFGKYLNLKGSSTPKRSISQCHASRCTFLKDGYIARCPLPFNIEHFNSYFDQNISMKCEWIHIYENNADGLAINKRLREPMESCRYCGNMEWVGWEKNSPDNRVKIEDFVQ